MTRGRQTAELRITHAEEVAPGVRSLILRPVAGGALPSFAPGSHIALSCGGQVNAYSLTNDGHDPDHYAISVRRQDDGRGGSVWLHNAPVGTVVDGAAPRCDFGPVRTARRHLLISAGIGLTPFLSYLRLVPRWGHAMQMLHVAPYGAVIPHLAELQDLAGPGNFQLARGRQAFAAALERALHSQPMGTHLYICGPAGFMDDVLAKAQAAGWPQARCHIERFGAAQSVSGQAFTAVLARSGRVVEVAAETSLLDALEEAGVSWPALCRNGVCGECRMDGVSGEITHHDFVLDDAERASGTCLMPCVSRARGGLSLICRESAMQPGPAYREASAQGTMRCQAALPGQVPPAPAPDAGRLPAAERQVPGLQPGLHASRFPWPFSADHYAYSANVEPAPGCVRTAAGAWGATILDVDGEYERELAERSAILQRDLSRYASLEHMREAGWDALLWGLRELAASNPTMRLERRGEAYEWTNPRLKTTQVFRYGDDSTLPMPPLMYLASQVQEDVVLLDQREGQLWVDAGCVTFASNWSMAFDAGMSFMEIHGPIPHDYADGAIPRAQQFLMRLQPGQVFRRLNWTSTAGYRLDTALDSYDQWGATRTAMARDPALAAFHMRVEVQHLIRLPRSGAIMFLIRTYLLPLADILGVPQWRAQFAAVLQTLPPDLAQYKGLGTIRQPLLRVLAGAERA
ncbi:DUF3445 domain-containing protein [Acetobacter sp. TBRC 12305]|uniref:DUF3445 domain-containing protein n=1 Tax=Acetobacter garciniae TaxID=2817435 RepID=A0A939HPB3_9PROT|nr:heme-dependent oxidative N-demethylase subunit alpha family protein [Acetobacter garciniae]MBO1324784.1 DUF3445 domain-containing protein [Acetobacter garciniae]MBX0344475.1 DUF3445 domain-containing protein [Acetobacter garciniae]